MKVQWILLLFPLSLGMTEERDRDRDLEKLQPFNELVGEWRGSAQPVRNSTRGAWAEKAEFVWHISKDAPEVLLNVKEGKQLTGGTFKADPESDKVLFTGNFADETTREFSGEWKEKKLLLVTEKNEEGEIFRLTVTRLNEKRTLLLLERSQSPSKQFSRIVEVGYTREGTRLAEEGTGGPVCIVTEGLGTIQVSHEGKTYWVCCSGCREAFEDDPEGIIEEAKKRAERKKEKQEKKAPERESDP